MGKAVRGSARQSGGWRTARLIGPLLAALLLFLPSAARAQSRRFDSGRFTVVAFPSDEQIARSLLASALARDTFPGLPRPTQRVLIAIAPDRRTFRAWIGPSAPEWGSAVAF